MKVLLNHSKVKDLHRKYPDHVGVLFSPNRTRFYEGKIPYAIDNGAFKNFDATNFLKVVRRSLTISPPMFIVCPDTIMNHAQTLSQWHEWKPKLKQFGYPLAFVAQDGCGINDVPIDADWVFIGGSDQYKDWAIANLKTDKPTHCGRVNNHSRLWKCFNHGINSIDGSGWFRAENRKRDSDLVNFLDFQLNQKKPPNELFLIGAYCQ